MAYWGNFNYLTKNQDKLQFQYRNMENALFTGIAINKYKLTAKRMSDLPRHPFCMEFNYVSESGKIPLGVDSSDCTCYLPESYIDLMKKIHE